jgi:hypothetical protein
MHMPKLHIFIPMDFNFHEQYKGLPTFELLKITERPEKYQPAAAAAAADILKGRVVTPADLEEVILFYQEADAPGQKKAEAIADYKNWMQAPGKWVNVILAIVVLQYLQLVYNDIKALDSLLNCENCPFRMVMLLSWVDVISLPVVLVMFYKRMQWGWILLFGSKLFTVLPSFMYYFKDYLPLPGASLFPNFLFGIGLNIGVIALLWRPDVTQFFKVNDRAKWFTAAATIFLLLLVFIERAVL